VWEALWDPKNQFWNFNPYIGCLFACAHNSLSSRFYSGCACNLGRPGNLSIPIRFYYWIRELNF
jgi:hypothetical protein